MNVSQLEKLLEREEGVNLEFKQQIDLGNNTGKAKFLREVLALANSPVSPAYFVIGVEDKTKKIVGFDGITEEQIQNIVLEWCYPPIDFDFHVVELKNKKVDVMEIYGGEVLHNLKKSLDYQDTDGKQRQLSVIQVPIRRGSLTDYATPQEIIHIAQRDKQDLSNIVSRLDRINESLEEIADSSQSSRHYEPRLSEPNEITETIFIALLTGLFLSWLWDPTQTWIIGTAGPIAFFLCIFASTFRITHFNFRHAFLVSAFIGIGLTLWFNFGIGLLLVVHNIATASLFGLVVNGFISSIIGLIVAVILMFWHPLGY